MLTRFACRSFRRLLVRSALVLMAAQAAALADGFIVVDCCPPRPVPPPRPIRPVPRIEYMPLAVRNHQVDCRITNTVAVTHIDQVFRNPSNNQVEGTYIFPLDDDISLTNFSMFVDGREVKGEVLDRDKAKAIYEDIVRRMRDPALLEYAGTRMYKARIAPIPPQGEIRVKLDYAQTVQSDDGMVKYRYPLNTEKFSAGEIEQVSVSVRIESDVPLKSVFCPSHNAAVHRPDDRHASASWEARNVLPTTDFVVYYTLSDKEFGLSLLTHRPAGEDGFFMARIAPKAEIERDEIQAKDICFVLDISGSMAGEKMEQAKRAMKFCLSNLNPDDRFNIIPFEAVVSPFKEELSPADSDNVAKAREFVDTLAARGGTNINDALLAAMKMRPTASERPFLVVFMTDGQPTIGVTGMKDILANVSQANASKVRLFVFGVGDDVNTHLLDQLSIDNHGAREYIGSKEDIEIKVSSFYGKVANPVLDSLELTFVGLGASDLYPAKLPDLFKGGEVVVMGRYRESGHHAITLTGKRNGKTETYTYEANFPSGQSEHDFLPRLWAVRKVGYLMDQIRLYGENRELKEEIVRLGIKYGIITPYTAYLITEEPRLYADSGIPAPMLKLLGHRVSSDEKLADAVAGVPAKGAVSGGKAVAASEMARKLSAADSGGFAGGGAGGREAGGADIFHLINTQPGGDGSPRQAAINQIGDRTFFFDGQRWVDSQYDGEKATVKLETFSSEYFDVIAAHPEAGRYFAQGPQVVVKIGDRFYETAAEGE